MLKFIIKPLILSALLLGHKYTLSANSYPAAKILVTPNVCAHGLHHGPGNKFAVFVFNDDAAGTSIGIINTTPGAAPTPEASQYWQLENRFWQDKKWSLDVESIEWDQDGTHLTVKTSPIYGTNKTYLLDLIHRQVIHEELNTN